jgi:adenylosuccinate synthase
VPPIGAEGFLNIEPIYEELPGWQTSTYGITRYEDLPEAARKYLERVREVTETEIAIISTGPDRAHTMVLHNPFD